MDERIASAAGSIGSAVEYGDGFLSVPLAIPETKADIAQVLLLSPQD